jgi:hypothetical protein
VVATIVRLPSSFRLDAIDRFTRDVVDANHQPKSDKFMFDFKPLGFIDGSGYTVLSNTLDWLFTSGVEIGFINYENMKIDAIRYLDDCGFFTRYLNYPLSRHSQARSTTLPCLSIENAQAFSWIEHRFSPWIGHTLDKGYGALSSIRSCLKELFNNISDHSNRETGFVHVQHYPRVHAITITVSDFGIGIPETIRAKFGAMTDAKAICYAAEEGITSQSRPNNMGAGLNYLIDTTVANGGNVTIHSLAGSLNCYRYKGQQVRRSSMGRGVYPGTLVEIQIDTRLFEGDEDERGEVEW